MVIVAYVMTVSIGYCYICYDSKLLLVVVVITYVMTVSTGYFYICYDSKLLLLLHMLW